MSQDGLFYFDSNNTAQGGPRLIRVSPSNPLPVNTNVGGGTQAVNLTQVGGSPVALGAATTSATAIPVTIAQDVTLPITGSVTATFGAGANVIGKVGIDQTTPGTTNAVQIIPGTSGGLTMYHAIVPNNVTGVVVKNSAGQLYSITLANNSANLGFLHLYNTSTAPTAGAGTIVKTLIAPAPAAGGGGGLVFAEPNGMAFSAGISYTFTTGIADTDTGVPAAATYSIDLNYK